MTFEVRGWMTNHEGGIGTPSLRRAAACPDAGLKSRRGRAAKGGGGQPLGPAIRETLDDRQSRTTARKATWPSPNYDSYKSFARSGRRKPGPAKTRARQATSTSPTSLIACGAARLRICTRRSSKGTSRRRSCTSRTRLTGWAALINFDPQDRIGDY